ncbi:MAG: protein kinase [Gemmatimonadales bacterium]
MQEALAPGTRLGPYEIGALIGAGGMGRVYRALDPRLGRNVAIKTMSGALASDPDALRRFETEAKAAGTLDHPNLLVVYDVGRENGVPYIVSELLDGETIRERLRRDGTIPERQAIDYAVQIARGLAAAHARGIVHRDLKPENLFVTRDRRLKILDFGVAKPISTPEGQDPSAVADALTASGVFVGTMGYMAPEQLLGERVDHRADIFALGVVMHEMLSGAAPFKRNSGPSTLAAILQADPPELPATVSPGLARIVRRCLEKAREDRFHSAHDLGLALELLSGATVTDPGGTANRAAAAGGVSRRQAITYAASGLALVASGLAGGFLLGGGAGSPASPSFQRLTFRRGMVRSARMAPDGETILYGALWDGDRCRVHTSRVGTPESSPLDLPNANLLAISPSGELALALGAHLDGVVTYGTLARVPITGGAPRELMEDVKFADWSPDGSELAIVRRVNGRDRLEYPIGTVLVEPAVGESNGLGFVRVSPDGRRIAFVHYRSPLSLAGRVSMVDLDGVVTPLTDEYVNIFGLAWNGDEIWYTAADDRPLFRSLCAVTPDGTQRTVARMPGNVTLWDTLPDGRLLIAHTDDRAVIIARLPGDAEDRDLSWLDASWVVDLSRDGQLLLLTENGQGGGPSGAAYLRRTDGSAAVRLADGQAFALSPDTQWVICGSPESPVGSSTPYLELVPTGAGDPRRLPDHGLAYTGARWLPEGDRFIALAAAPGQRQRLFLLTLGQDPPTPVTPEGVTFWAISPDGSTVAATGPTPTIRLYPVDGGEPRDIPGLTGAEFPVGWIRGGLLVLRPGDPDAPRGEVYLVDERTARQERWSNILPNDPAGIMLLATFRVTPDGRTHASAWHRAVSNLYLADGVEL